MKFTGHAIGIYHSRHSTEAGSVGAEIRARKPTHSGQVNRTFSFNMCNCGTPRLMNRDNRVELISFRSPQLHCSDTNVRMGPVHVSRDWHRMGWGMCYRRAEQSVLDGLNSESRLETWLEVQCGEMRKHSEMR